jgi:putative nucleotidyltransferase with HDIG domain
MNRDDALAVIRSNIKNRNILRHMLAVEAIMRGLAEHLGEDEDLWGLTGLVHDVDYEKTAGNFKEHGVLAQRILKGKVPEESLRAILAHNYKNTGVMPDKTLDKALIAADAISGLIVACALVMPSKKVKDVKVRTVKRKFKDKDFARGADRKRIVLCEELGIPKEEFFEIALKAIQKVAKDLGL